MKRRFNTTEPEIQERARELRQRAVPPEVRLWGRLRNRQLGGYKFRRQHPIGRFVVDFCCMDCFLVVELDGETHLERVGYDAERTKWLEEQGYRVLRFANSDVVNDIEAVLATILTACEEASG